jgi:hypothetical protein
MSIPVGHKTNLDTLCRAAKRGDICVMECADRNTRQPVWAICAVNRGPGGSCEMIPIAKLFDGNPYDELDPPTV